jgi:tRNA(Ile)-lysidine synthase
MDSPRPPVTVGPDNTAEAVPGRADASVLRLRQAVRELLTEARDHGLLDSGDLGVAVSGGADSLAMAEAANHAGTRAGLRVRGLIVDHGLQPDSAEIAARAEAQLHRLGVTQVEVLRVTVTGPGGLEAAARRARYAALRAALPDGLVLLGHTLDDQAETVLLGLARGSGPRSIAGMRPLDPPWGRPLLAIPRATTLAACASLGLRPWSDPHNTDPAFTRVRLRHEVLPLLEEVLQGGVAGALARTAAQLREDSDALDQIAAGVRAGAGPGELAVDALADEPSAVRRRVLRGWLLAEGVPELTDAHLRRVDALVDEWRGQGGVWLPGGFVAHRAHGRLRVEIRKS